ncbi:MAG: flagellar hook-associated protein FlgL [Synergistaceae bacterium]|jgi:flagellin-like hook-associated protein FlgL|nr:flagellar hook-associated protein FlgL [Synergistaceae bacterium]
MAYRVTTSMMYNSLTGSLQSNMQKLLDLEQQMSTGRKFSKLSDSPAEIARALSLQSSIASNSRYITNQEDSITMLKLSETAMQTVVDSVEEIRKLVIQAGNGTLGPSEVEAIATEIEAMKQQILDTLNKKAAGKYIFGGADTTHPPFVMDPSGQIRYVGSNERIRYEIEEGLLGDVSFTGADIVPKDNQSYFVCSHYVPLDWKWTGREEKVQIMVGSRTLPVYIPEQWLDEVATGTEKPTDYNQFRDPDELTGISLDDLSTLVNRALKEQGADMLVTATVEKDYNSNQQRLVFKSNTGEPISITDWPDTDYLPLPQSIAGLKMDSAFFSSNDWNETWLVGSTEPNFGAMAGKALTVYLDGTAGTAMNLNSFLSSYFPPDPTVDDLAAWMNMSGNLPAGVTASAWNGKIVFTSPPGSKIQVDGTGLDAVTGGIKVSEPPRHSGLMGTTNVLGWRGDSLNKAISITIAGHPSETFELDDYRNINELVNAINAKMPTGAGDEPFASLVAGRLVLQSTLGQVEVQDDTTAPYTSGGTMQLFGYAGGMPPLKSTFSSLTVKLGEALPMRVFVNEGDGITEIAERLNAIEGLYARTSADGTQLVVAAQRTGDAPSDPLAVNAAQEKQHYPSFTIWGEGMAMSLFDYSHSVAPASTLEQGIVGSKEQTRPVDHSHIDVFDYLGMETALTSREYKAGEVLKVGTETPPGSGTYTGDPLHWRVVSGSHVTEITLNPGEYTMEQLAERLRNAGVGWLEVTVDPSRTPGSSNMDDYETGLGTSANEEPATSRLVIRSKDGSPVAIMDMNASRYAETVGLSTALRTDDKTGLDEIRFPSAPCLDDNLAAMVRVQMTCGKTYDIRLTRKDAGTLNPAYQPNPALPGYDPNTHFADRVKVMEQIAKQVNEQAGYEIMKVVIPVDDVTGQPLPNSASLAAVTGEPFEVVDLPILDPSWSDSYTAGIAAQMGIHGGVTSVPAMDDDDIVNSTGTIRFETLGHSVEIDVGPNDTVKSIMDRLRSQAGDWLYVNYFDQNMGNVGYLGGNDPVISIAAKDGSAVNVIDAAGTVAQNQLLLNTSIQGSLKLDDPADPNYWQTAVGATPPSTFSITVAGYTHTIDLTAMRDINGNGNMDAADLVAAINARMQDYDVRAELNKDGCLVLWSPRGYSIEAEAWGPDTSVPPNIVDITGDFLGTGTSSTPYRGGYDLQGSNTPGYVRAAPGIYTQNVVTRSGANQTRQNFFGVLDDIAAAVRAENRDGLSDKLLPKIDAFMDNVLKFISASGALQIRYESNRSRMELDGISMTETHDRLFVPEIDELTTQLMMAQTVYQASLGVISYIVQPTLLNYLR